jgi:uncharacterized phage protein gp47/JayE
VPWDTPTLKEVRSLVRDAIEGQLPGADANIPNSVLRVVSDVQGALCHLVLQYVDWLSLQLLPDTAEAQWLDRHAQIWLVNADGSTGRKLATPAQGEVILLARSSIFVPAGTEFTYATTGNYATTTDVLLQANTPANAPVIALTPGAASNLDPGTILGTTLAGISVTVDPNGLIGGTDTETDDELRMRVLMRIREPPMGGDADDYVQWALAVPGVTRAWCSPLEMGMGTVTVRFMMDDLRATPGNPLTDGFPLQQDITAVANYLNSVRPVAVKDFFVVAPIPEPINFTVANLNTSDADVQGAIVVSVTAMLKQKAAPAFALNGVGQPAQTIYAAWVSDAILQTPGVEYFDLIMNDHVMPTMGSLGVMGTATFI